MLPSGQPCGGGLVGDDEELLERDLLERMAKPLCGGTLGKVIIVWICKGEVFRYFEREERESGVCLNFCYFSF